MVKVDEIALSPALINRSPGNRLIAVLYGKKGSISLYDVYIGHLHAQILGQKIHMGFIRDGTKLVYYYSGFGLRIWDIADLLIEPWHSGYEPLLQGMRNGYWVGEMSHCFGSQRAQERSTRATIV